MKTYKPVKLNVWRGRVDSCTDRGCLRWHQVMNLFDLRDINTVPSTPKGFKYFAFLGFCCDEGVKRNQGRTDAARGPAAIRESMASFPVHSDDRVQFFDAGDIICRSKDMEKAQADLALAVQILLSKGMIPVVLGGGHEMALGNGLGVLEYLSRQKGKKRLGIINFDAHFDLRCLEKKRGTSGTPFTQLYKQFKAYKQKFRYLCLGIQHSANTSCLFHRAKKFGANFILRDSMVLKNNSSVQRQVRSFIKSVDSVYLTLCSDVFAQAFAPGVSAPQACGIYPEEFFAVFKMILQSKKVVCFDVAEVAPDLDSDHQTARLAAKIIFEFVYCDGWRVN